MRFNTHSLCPVCYNIIPALVVAGETEYVMMQKICPEHGPTKSMVERDTGFYLFCKGNFTCLRIAMWTNLSFVCFFIDVGPVLELLYD